MLIGYGIYSLHAHRALLICYCAGAFVILLLWPDVWWGPRFLLPLIPLLLFFIVQGLFSLLQWGTAKYLNKRKIPFVVYGITLFIMVFSASFSSLHNLHHRANSPYQQHWKNYFQIAEWVKKNTPESTTVCCRKPSLFYMYANRRSASYKFLEDDQALIDDIRNRKFDYVVIEQLNFSSTLRYLYPAVRKNPKNFTPVLFLDEPPTYLLKFNP